MVFQYDDDGGDGDVGTICEVVIKLFQKHFKIVIYTKCHSKQAHLPNKKLKKKETNWNVIVRHTTPSLKRGTPMAAISNRSKKKNKYKIFSVWVFFSLSALSDIYLPHIYRSSSFLFLFHSWFYLKHAFSPSQHKHTWKKPNFYNLCAVYYLFMLFYLQRTVVISRFVHLWGTKRENCEQHHETSSYLLYQKLTISIELKSFWFRNWIFNGPRKIFRF